jgi:hypothetical protein
MTRVQFEKGKQREFLESIKVRLNLISLRSIKQFGIEINYSTMKNYHNEKRLMPEELFKELCHLARINHEELKTKKVEDNWGQIKGGRRGIISMRKKYSKNLADWRRAGGNARPKRLI